MYNISDNIKIFIENNIDKIDKESLSEAELFEILELVPYYNIEYTEISNLLNIFTEVLEMKDIINMREKLIVIKIIEACDKWQRSSSKNKSEIKLRDLIDRYTNSNFYGVMGKDIEQFCTRINHPTFKFIPAFGHRKRLYVQYIG